MRDLIGIDVGGTNTDAVLVHEGKVVATARAATDRSRLLAGTAAVLRELLRSVSKAGSGEIELHLSTTLSTNAIVERRGDPTAVLAVPGPGLNPADLGFGFPIHQLSGAIDHRGREVTPLTDTEVRSAIREANLEGARALAVVGKFSTRNPCQELEIEQIARSETPGFGSVTLGHRLSGRLNFPRRITTAYLNSNVAGIQTDFARMVRELLTETAITGPVFLLKADGGTLRLEDATARPVETILSGPAASIMGTLALTREPLNNAVILDIGGTTTDISVLVNGEPLNERNGAEISGYKTSVPALFSRSIGLGGDSKVVWENGKIRIGPGRDGPPAIFGGPVVTPTDAVAALGLAPLGEVFRGLAALEPLAVQAGISPAELAEKVVAEFCSLAASAVRGVYRDLASRPVYTVSEVLAPCNLKPDRIIGLGAPAATYIPLIAVKLDVPYTVLPYPEVANAVGAAASRPTAAITLHADTALGRVVIPELDYSDTIDRPLLYETKQARAEALAHTRELAARIGVATDGAAAEIVHEEVFNMVRGFHTVGRIYTIQAQLRPGVIPIRIDR
ncbi:MAG TPA: hydantoinase/oxoprolinase family protein [Bacillota bacterium]